MVVTGLHVHQGKLGILLGRNGAPSYGHKLRRCRRGPAAFAQAPLAFSTLSPCKDRLWWSCKLLEICPETGFCEGDSYFVSKKLPKVFSPHICIYIFFTHNMLTRICYFHCKNISNNHRCWISAFSWAASWTSILPTTNLPPFPH